MDEKELRKLAGLSSERIDEAAGQKERDGLVAEVLSTASRIKEFGKVPASRALAEMLADKTIKPQELQIALDLLGDWNDLMQAAAGDT